MAVALDDGLQAPLVGVGLDLSDIVVDAPGPVPGHPGGMPQAHVPGLLQWLPISARIPFKGVLREGLLRLDMLMARPCHSPARGGLLTGPDVDGGPLARLLDPLGYLGQGGFKLGTHTPVLWPFRPPAASPGRRQPCAGAGVHPPTWPRLPRPWCDPPNAPAWAGCPGPCSTWPSPGP